MAVALLAFYGIIVAVPPLRVLDYTLIGVGVVAWALLLRLVWRMRLFERLLSYQGLSAKPDTFHGDA
jgi:hypothetical protein